jgi:hypothetical protein
VKLLCIFAEGNLDFRGICQKDFLLKAYSRNYQMKFEFTWGFSTGLLHQIKNSELKDKSTNRMKQEIGSKTQFKIRLITAKF